MWIRLQGLPLECWSANALGKLASFVGEPIAADECTATMSKISYARILVEVDVKNPLVREIKTFLPDGSLLVQAVTYEKEPLLCSKCMRLGHKEGICRSMSNRAEVRAANSLHSQQTTTEDPLLVMHRTGPLGAAGHIEGETLLPGAMDLAGNVAVIQEGVLDVLLRASPSSQKQNHMPAANKQLAVPLIATAPSPAELHIHKDMPHSIQNQLKIQQVAKQLTSPQHVITQQQEADMQASSPSAAIPWAVETPHPAKKMQHVVDLQGTLATSNANSTANSYLQDQGHVSAALLQDHGQDSAALLQLYAPSKPVNQHPTANQVQNAAAIKHDAGEEITLQAAEPGQIMRLTRSASAKIVQQLHYKDLNASAGAVHDESAVNELLKQRDVATNLGIDQEGKCSAQTAFVPKQQKWGTMKSKSRKKRR